MIRLLAAALVVVLGVLAWRYPARRVAIGVVLIALVVGGWAWLTFGPQADAPPLAPPAPVMLELERVALEPWFGEHRLSGVAHNRADAGVVTGFTVRLTLRDCTDEGCTPLGVHRHRITLRVPPSASTEFERRVRLLPGTGFTVAGRLEFDIHVDEVHRRLQ